MNPDEAKQKVWEHWGLLNGLSDRRFPGKAGEAEEALNYALDKLEENDWSRVRTWQGQSTFPTFLSVLVKRLFTDFTRKKYGHHREPKWLQEKQDPIWHSVYKLLVERNHSRQEVIEILACDNLRERWFLEEVVCTINARCRPIVKPRKVSNGDTELNMIPNGVNPEPPKQLIDGEIERIADILCHYIDDVSESTLPSEVRENLERLKTFLQLNDEDRLIVRLHIVEGVNLQKIKRMLQFNRDIYKRYKKIVKQIQDGCIRAGLVQK